jgi:hypothetical protein
MKLLLFDNETGTKVEYIGANEAAAILDFRYQVKRFNWEPIGKLIYL